MDATAKTTKNMKSALYLIAAILALALMEFAKRESIQVLSFYIFIICIAICIACAIYDTTED